MLLTKINRESRLFYRKCTRKSFMPICLYIGLFTLFIQVCIFLSILILFEDNFEWKMLTGMSDTLQSKQLDKSKDFKLLSSIFYDSDIKIIPFDKYILFNQIKSKLQPRTLQECITCHVSENSPIILGIFMTRAKEKLVEKLQNAQFLVTTFYNTKPAQEVPELADIQIAYLIQRTAIFHVVILHVREDNTLWYGNLQSDFNSNSKLAKFGLNIKDIQLMTHEGSIEKFELVPAINENDRNIFFPKNIPQLLKELEHSKFVECNITRANMFHEQFQRDTSAVATRFRHRAWKLLARAKTVLDSLGIVFWISSGTFLGYHRECDIIAHSKDVDLGLWAHDYTHNLVTEMRSHGFNLKIWLGRPNDSLELSFIDQGGIKLDLFFFYEEEKNVWNGGTQVKSGKKFKYNFPKFELCWTLFLDLKLRVPCDTETYIRANYGPNWFHPVTSWDWKTSPFNVHPNGMWKPEEFHEVIKVFS